MSKVPLQISVARRFVTSLLVELKGLCRIHLGTDEPSVGELSRPATVSEDFAEKRTTLTVILTERTRALMSTT